MPHENQFVFMALDISRKYGNEYYVYYFMIGHELISEFPSLPQGICFIVFFF